ncbi:MAG: hypothetical protein ABS87_11115 [Sphingomonas sp. SCN 67-18]|uniref:hypothetical protein n=1 Tax=uncultured Sphingomonas sp. TaxID=158754 RepID=UPI00086A9E57|nr:hypothetical protein [Sphingomonas sp. SCN 67-18]ODU20331.1 MAG: hypothetical protein ABS87_11115 [Sphingomonas sp. SCN 67-18]
MDLSFNRFEPAARGGRAVMPDYAILLAGLSARQSSSLTSIAQSAIDRRDPETAPAIAPLVALFAPVANQRIHVSGSFSPAVAALLTAAQQS